MPQFPPWLFLFLIFASSIPHIKSLEILPSEKELILPPGSSVEIQCTHDEPIEWVYGLTETGESGESKKSTSGSFINGTYTRILSLHRLDYLDTAFYICTQISNNDVQKEIYIFVRDLKHLLAVRDSYNIIHYSPEDETLIIPCRPSAPDANVTLTYDDKKDTDFYYDRKVGFRALRKFTTAIFTCEAKLYNLYAEAIYDVLISSDQSDLPTPVIELNGNQNKNSVILGSKVVLKCSIQVEISAVVFLKWEVQNPKIVLKPVISAQVGTFPNSKVGYSIITIDKVTKEHEGFYKCSVQDQSNRNVSASYNLQVLSNDVNYLKLELTNGNSTIHVKPGSLKVFWSVSIDAHPNATYDWHGPENDILSPSAKFHITRTETLTEVLIKGISVVDSGKYTLIATSGQLTKHLDVELIVEGEPFVELRMIHPEYRLNSSIYVVCTIISFPLSNGSIAFTECEDYATCGSKNTGKTTQYKVERSCSTNFHCRFVTQIVTSKIGFLNCSACNYLGCHWSKSIINITDVPKGLAIFKPTLPLLTNESVSLTCGASAYKYLKPKFTWSHQGIGGPAHELRNNTEQTISNIASSPFSHKSVLQIKELKKNRTGFFKCHVYDLESKLNNSTQLYVDVVDGETPYFIDGKNNFTKYRLNIGDESLWNCSIGGVPRPNIYWYKNKTQIAVNSSSVHLLNNNRTLKISFVKQDDSGTYKCIGINKLGQVSAGFKLSVDMQVESLAWLWALLACLITIAVIFFCIMVCLIRKVKHEKELRKQLAEVGLSTFLEGQTESLNPNLTMAEQANLLPYDRKWEFPRHKLQIGKQVGSGAFGVVLKGVAYGIRDDEDSTIVAIKMNSDWNNVKELATELKIMAYLGQHLNVVNLLGACTANLHKKELLVIVEYCPYGNLHNYLMKHKNSFVNHLREGEVDPNVYQKFYRTKSMLSNSTYADSNIQSNGTCVTQLTTSGDASNTEGRENPAAAPDTPIGEDGYLMNKEMEEFVKKSEENRPRKKIYTSDLLCFSYQIARGMEYLASRKVLHGDLAARNILLADNNIVKICDFGMAKNMYDNINYTKSPNSILPVKWMSIEAIRDRIFSTQSDVWAYGITLWEIFSLSTTPYPGTPFGTPLFTSLVEGYRMERPTFATKDIYNLMLECWREEPMLRPSFTECSERIGNMLQEHVKQRYESMNSQYQKLNKLYQQADYVEMFNCPNYVNVVDVTPDPVPSTPPGYLKMAKTPSIPEEEVEMTPMLKENEH